MSYNFNAKNVACLAFKEIKYKPEEIKILIIGMNETAKKINEEVKKKCSNIYCTNQNLDSTNENKLIDPTHLKEEICKMDIVFVTENKPIINKNMLILMSTETIIVDLTKEKNSIDYESAKKLKIKVIKVEI